MNNCLLLQIFSSKKHFMIYGPKKNFASLKIKGLDIPIAYVSVQNFFSTVIFKQKRHNNK